MSESTFKARIVRITYEEGKTGLFYAFSPDMKGLVVARKSPEELEFAIPQAIKDMYAACDMRVVVSRLHDDNHEDDSWVAFPADVARADFAAEAEAAT